MKALEVKTVSRFLVLILVNILVLKIVDNVIVEKLKMKLPWKSYKPKTTSDVKLEQIKQILFPQLELKEEMSNDGSVIKYHVDYSVDSNIDAVLMDLQDGQNDPVAHDTLNKMVSRLHKARQLLEAYAKLDSAARYIIVDNGNSDIEKILADED